MSSPLPLSEIQVLAAAALADPDASSLFEKQMGVAPLALQALAENGYFAGERDPKIKPEFEGRFMVCDREDADGFSIVGAHLEPLVTEAISHLEIDLLDEDLESVIDDVLDRAEKYEFKPEPHTVKEMVQNSADLLGLELSSEQTDKACSRLLYEKRTNTLEQEPVAPMIAEIKAIPDGVKRSIEFHVARLQDNALALEGVMRARGTGHILELELGDRNAAITKAYSTLSEIHQLSVSNGVELEFKALIAGANLPDMTKFGFSADAVPDFLAPQKFLSMTGQEQVSLLDSPALRKVKLSQQADAKEAAKLALMQALKQATESGLFDDMANDVHPDTIKYFCDAVKDFEVRSDEAEYGEVVSAVADANELTWIGDAESAVAIGPTGLKMAIRTGNEVVTFAEVQKRLEASEMGDDLPCVMSSFGVDYEAACFAIFGMQFHEAISLMNQAQQTPLQVDKDNSPSPGM